MYLTETKRFRQDCKAKLIKEIYVDIKCRNEKGATLQIILCESFVCIVKYTREQSNGGMSSKPFSMNLLGVLGSTTREPFCSLGLLTPAHPVTEYNA
ncbi:hypothetical protein PHMEG_00036121 [Phytophthora megakarya]|uniref:Uncharacterized protein n=1 Tax=Phytophthora megakarya TaxID=4795 RepID=A0A225ULV5_9STRA|nr:hypothetical protein PHMEG_00036121 [Phytophthora megakarya]